MNYLRRCSLLLLPLLGAVVSAPLPAAVALYTVGSDASCDYRTDLLPNALQSAISAVPLTVPAGDLYVIHVARNGNYDGKQVVINDREMLIEGGYTSCDDFVIDTTNTVIDSMAMNVGAVMRIDGMSSRKPITLSHLTLSGGTGVSGNGLYIRNADVRLNHVSLSDNHGAIRGGGLHIEGIEHGASVEIYGGSGIFQNSVLQNGGGIRCENGAELAIHSDSGISNNSADFLGGGISINGCTGYVNSGGSGLAVLVFNVGYNAAPDGAGIALESSLGPTRIVIGEGLGAVDPRPAIIANNATARGGGIFAIGADTELAVRNSVIDSNTAVSTGGGIQVVNGARVAVERSLNSCDSGYADCSLISNNTASYGGAVAAAGFQSGLTLEGTLVTGNSAGNGGSAILVTQQSIAAVSDSFLVGNSGPSVVEISPASSLPPRSASIYMGASTIAGNTGLSAVVDINDEGTATFNRMLVNAGAMTPSVVKGAGNANPTYLCSVFHESASISGEDGLTAFSSSPGFINAGAGNYHLLPGGFAVDRCPADSFLLPTDYDLDPRPIDAPIVNMAGPYDVGADEWSNVLFADGFEG